MQSDNLEQAVDQAVEIALLRKDVEALTSQLGKISTDVEELVKAWNTASYVVVFVKWLAGIVTAGTVIYTFLTHYFEK